MSEVSAILPRTRSFNGQKLTAIVCGIALAFPLLGYAYLGGFSRQVADDYCAGRNLHQHGFWGSQLWTYRNHSGRFFSYFVRIAAEFIGQQRIVPYLAAILLMSWLAVTTWTFWQFARWFGMRERFRNSLVLSELFIFSMLRTGPDPGQSFFWEAGSLTYTLPIILITAYLGLLLHYLIGEPREVRKTVLLLLAGIILFSAAGTSETNAAVQCAGLLAAILAIKYVPALTRTMRRSLPALYFGFWGSLLASLLVMIAPGNAVREGAQRRVLAGLPLSVVIAKGVIGSAVFVFDFLHNRPLAALALLIVPGVVVWLGKSTSGVDWRWDTNIGVWLLAIAFSFVLIVSCTIPGVYALSTIPPERAQFMTHWILLVTLLCTGVALGSATKRWLLDVPNLVTTLLASFFVLSLVLPWVLKSTWNIAASIRESRLYAAEWDREDAEIRRRKGLGDLNMVVPWNARISGGGNVGGAPWLAPDPAFWVNTCQADYYGLHSLRTSVSEIENRK